MNEIETDLVVLGAGPGGYAAAFYAADRGMKVLLVEREARLGGICLNSGCIPSKALLHATEILPAARASEVRGIAFDSPRVNLHRLRDWKTSILDSLGEGIGSIAKARNVPVAHGRGYFESSSSLRVETAEGQQFVNFKHAIIAVGSRSAMPKAFNLGNPRVMTSGEALDVEEIPGRLLVVGGGYIGMELGTVYARLGSAVTVVEALPSILTSADNDLKQPVVRAASKAFREFRLSTEVKEMSTSGRQIRVIMEGPDGAKDELWGRVLLAVGRAPNCEDIGLENTKVRTGEKGFIAVNACQQTDDPAIYAIGDVAGGVLLAHKASKEARIAVDAILGESIHRNGLLVPAVVFTDPEIAWVGLTESEAMEKNVPFKIAKFPWAASGRALTFDRPDGLTKLVIDPESERILGVGIAGHGAGELIAEGALALEMGATAFDLAATIHPHPTLSETLMECAEAFYGTATHMVRSKKPAL